MSFYKNIGNEQILEAEKMAKSIYRYYSDARTSTLNEHRRFAAGGFAVHMYDKSESGPWINPYRLSRDFIHDHEKLRNHLWIRNRIDSRIRFKIDLIGNSCTRFNLLLIENALLSGKLVQTWDKNDNEHNFSL